MRITGALLAALFLCLASTARAEEVDRKTLWTLLPCKSAALRLCDRSQGINPAALLRCGVTLAERHNEIGPRCINALKRYGQL